MPTDSPHCAAKGGLRMLMRTIAVELAPRNITVNTAPGTGAPHINRETVGDGDLMEELLSEVALECMAKPEEIGRLAAYPAAYVTGSTFVIDEGMMRPRSGIFWDEEGVATKFAFDSKGQSPEPGTTVFLVDPWTIHQWSGGAYHR